MTVKLMSKEEAWKELPNQQFIPIVNEKKKYTLRRRWFHHRNCCTFSTFLVPKFPPGDPYKMLTIGVFEGAQEVWLMQNILTHPDAKLYCIDPWMDTGKLDQTFMDQCMENAKSNLSEWKSQVHLQRGYSQKIMKDAVREKNYFGEQMGTFDLVIIDGDHNRIPVIEDATNALEFVKPGGWLLFDDVRNRVPKKEHVWDGLIDFMDGNPDRVKLVWEHRYCSCLEKIQ